VLEEDAYLVNVLGRGFCAGVRNNEAVQGDDGYGGGQP